MCAIHPCNSKVITCAPDPQAYCNNNEALACFMLYDFSSGISEVDVNKQTVFGCSDLTVFEKLLNHQLKN